MEGAIIIFKILVKVRGNGYAADFRLALPVEE
jgi:hypothetical protein